MSKSLRASLCVLAAALMGMLMGCGFYLKGQKPLPPEMSELYLSYPHAFQTVRLGDTLRSGLARRGARVVSNTSTPNRLTVYSLPENSRVLSVGRTGYAIEYEIEITAEFDYTVNGQVRVPRQSVTVLRDYSSDETRILAGEAEIEGLRNAMYEEIANLILLRVDAQLSNPQPSEAEAAEPAG